MTWHSKISDESRQIKRTYLRKVAVNQAIVEWIFPSAGDSRDLTIDDVPGKMDDWLYNGWGSDMLDDSRIYGPILAKRSIGTWSGLQLYFEVWPLLNAAGLGTEYFVEASFKTTNATTASTKHDALITYLQSHGWFLAQESLKTQLIMDRH
ncbi:hypothetical protein [Paenibacillus psychroresistens]|uniref:hypothetical protein n=1 Tax=Paenibacillus psychroresistens TaxID=1778678 RepID=UPI001D038E4D|nr:hypothetical protein [Paenibacillus psychroresistens]